jgi:hypothetical protein
MSSMMIIPFGFILLLGGEKTPTFSEGKSLVAKRVSDSERDCDQTSLVGYWLERKPTRL